MYASRLGFWRTYAMTMIYRYLDCGDLHMGFARVRSDDCFDWKLLAKLSVCVWNVIKRYLQSSVDDKDAVPGTSISVQSFGDFLNFNPHLHAIVSDGCFSKDGDFHMAPGFMLKDLEEIF